MIGAIISGIVLGYILIMIFCMAVMEDKNFKKLYVAMIWPILVIMLFIKYLILAFKTLPEIWKM